MQQCEAVLALAAATERLTGVRGLGLGKKSVSTLPPGDTSAEGFFFVILSEVASLATTDKIKWHR